MIRRLVLLTIFFSIIILFLSESFSEEKKVPIVVDGDKVEFFSDTKEMTAEGNVIISYQDSRLTCDKVRVNTQTKDALAEGNVHLVSKKGEIRGDKVEYNFEKSVGKIINGDIAAEPYYGRGGVIDRVDENEFVVKSGYITTCDLDHPHYKLQAKSIEIYPEDKVVAKDVVFKLGNIPLFYIPKFVQRLDEKRPHVRVVPGKNKDWGYFLLQAWRYDFNQFINGRFHIDYREKKDFAWGFDNNFSSPLLGEGTLRTYYTHERNIKSKHIWDEDRQTQERERYRIQLLQSKEVNTDTSMIFQLNKMSDSEFIEDYFYREYEKDYKPDSYLLLTQAKPYHNLSLLVRKRFNRFFAETERLPELKLDIPALRVGETNFYVENSSSSSILENKGAAPSDLKQKIYRFDSYNELSHQKKVAFIETRPYVGFRESYFSKDLSYEEDIWRNAFYCGIDLSTKFYRMFNVSHDSWLLKFKDLRHIITPTISYNYIRKPNVVSSSLIQYDEVDSVDKKSSVTFGLENKLQTKRNNTSVDLLRLIVDTDYLFKHQLERGSRFSKINSDLEFLPNDWIRIDADSVYDRDIDKFSSVNFDFYFHDTSKEQKWSLGIGKRYERKSSNQLTLGFDFKPNEKIQFRIYERLYPNSGNLIEQEYTIVRDLHCWQMELTYNVHRGEGASILLIFRLKAFPDIGFDWNKEYNRPKSGSQLE